MGSAHSRESAGPVDRQVGELPGGEPATQFTRTDPITTNQPIYAGDYLCLCHTPVAATLSTDIQKKQLDSVAREMAKQVARAAAVHLEAPGGRWPVRK